jgi:hypothetical protein
VDWCGTHLFGAVYIKIIVLPRQTRNKHRRTVEEKGKRFLSADGDSPRTEVVHAVINQHNPPGYPAGSMTAKGYPYSCPASSFCGGALRVGNYKLLVGYPGWDEHYAYPNNNRINPNTQLHWEVCSPHCLFDVGPGADIAELHDLSVSKRLLKSLSIV